MGKPGGCKEQIRNRFQYYGEAQDPVSQQYHIRARYNNPVIGRFIQEDTYRGDRLDLYAYCANNPVNYVDPSRHWCETKQDIYNKLEAEARSRGEVIDGARKLELMAEAANAAKGKNAGADPVIYLEGGSGTKSLGKQTTAADWNGKTNELAKSAPIDIPENATVKIQNKTGYDQIVYKWSDGTYKYEVRWHTKTPGAPSGQGNTWVIERTTPGTPTGQRAVTHILTGEGQWTTRYEWQQAITAYQNGTATEAQKSLLENGHWPGL